MPLEDNVIIRFTVQQQQLQNALSQISSQLGNIGRQAPQLGRATQGMAQVGRQVQANTRVFNAHNRSVGKAGGMLQDLQSQTGAFTSSFRKAAMSIQTGTGWLDRFAIQADRASMMMWKFSMSAVSLNQLAATTGAVALGFGMVTKKMVDSFSMVDRIKRQFVSIYQSAEIGGKMVDQLVTDAVKIRYTVEQVLEAGRLLAIEGFNPQDLIYDMSDLAAGVNQEGISVVNATRAFVDATNGQFRRLKETFQITREDAMAFAPDAFQGPNNQISNQAKATDAIIRAIRSKYRGMNEATMQTIGGMLSNVDDAMVKSMAKMGQAIEGTVVGWLNVIMGTFEKIEAFADTGLGKAVANTLLWGTAIMGAVTALALLGAGMITILGLFAAYRVFTQTRGEGVRDIISAELKLMAVQQEIAKFEAMRSAQDIEGLQLKLALSKAVFAEEQKRLQLMGVPLPGGKSNPVNDASLESLTAARMKAQAQVDVIAKPRELLGLNDNLKTTQDEIAAIERTSLGVQSERYAVLKAQEQTMLRQQALMQAQIADAKAIAGGGVGGNEERVIAQQARADADALAAKAAVEEAKATALQTEADQLSANVTALSTQQTELATIATDLDTAAREANTAAILANAEAKATAFKFTEKQKMVSSLATGRDVELFDIDTRIKEQQLERMRGNTRNIMSEGSADDLAEHSLRMERLAAEIEQRHEKLLEMQSQAAIRQGSEQELGQLEEEARLRREAADAAAIRRRETAAAARENSTGLRNVNRELAQQERQLERTTNALNKQREVAGSLQAQAAAAAGSATAAESVAGVGGASVVGGLQQEVRALEEQLHRGKRKAIGISNEMVVVGEREKAQLVEVLARQKQINIELEKRLALKRAELATAEGTAVADVAGMGGAARFGRGMMAGAGAVFGPILGLVEGIANIVAGPFIALGQAIGAANLGFVGIAGVVTGFAAALASLIGVAYLVSSTLKYDAQSLRSFRDGLDEATDKLKGWADLLNPNPTQTSGLERANAGRTAMGKIGEMGSFGEFQGLDSIPAEYLKRALIPGYGLRAAFENSPVPGMDRNKFRIGDRLIKSQDGDLGKSQEILADMIRAAQASGNVPKALEGMTPEMAKGMDAAAIKEIIVTEDERRQLAADLDSYYRSMNKEIEKQGFALDRQAIQWMKARIASGELTEEEKERYKIMLASATPAKDLNKHLKDSFKSAEQMIPDLRDIEEVISDGMAAGKPDADIQGEIKKDRDAAAQKLKEMEASLEAQRDMGFQISTEDERRVKQLHEQVDLVNRQVNLYGTIKQLLADIKAQGAVSASGMGNTGAIFGDDIAAGEWAKAQAEKDPKKRQTAIENAFKAARASREDKAKQALDLYAPGPTASPQEKADYERYKAKVEKWKMDRAESDYRKAMSAGNLTDEQKARAEMQIVAERRQSNNAIKGYNKSARDIEFDDQIKQMDARRRGAAVAGASPQQLAQLDMNILRIRMQQAKVNNDITEQMNLQVQAAEIMRGLQDAALGTEEAKLSYMQTQADQGLISQDAVDAEKRQLAAMYQNRARQAAAGSQEYYENMNKALSLLGENTEEKWSGIIGKILGAPQSLIDSVVSSGWITQGFGGMENQFGMGRGMQAEIASQSRREMVIRVSWDLGSVDRRLEAAVPSAINAFGREFVRGYGAA